jgi:hypothetical protein
MITSFLSIALSLLSSLWGSSAGRIILIGGGLFVFGLIKGWGWASESTADVIRARDMEWQQKIERANRDAENDTNARVQAAIEAAAAIVSVGPDRSDVERLCRSDKNCRADELGPKSEPRSLPLSEASNVVTK